MGCRSRSPSRGLSSALRPHHPGLRHRHGHRRPRSSRAGRPGPRRNRARPCRRTRMRSGFVCPAPSRSTDPLARSWRVSAIVTCSTMPSPTGSWALSVIRTNTPPFSTNVFGGRNPGHSETQAAADIVRVVHAPKIRGQLGGLERDRAAEVPKTVVEQPFRTPLVEVRRLDVTGGNMITSYFALRSGVARRPGRKCTNRVLRIHQGQPKPTVVLCVDPGVEQGNPRHGNRMLLHLDLAADGARTGGDAVADLIVRGDSGSLPRRESGTGRRHISRPRPRTALRRRTS